MSDRYQQVLKAALVGDALGRPFNGLKQGHVQQVLGGSPEGFLTTPLLFPDKPGKNVLPGLHSQMGQRLLASMAVKLPDEMGRGALALVGEQLKELAGGDVEDQDFYGSMRNPGRPLRRALLRWRVEFPWEEKDFLAKQESSEGLSTASLGLVPVCLGLDEPHDWAKRLARLTHLRQMSLVGAMVVARVLELVLEDGGGKKLDGAGIVRSLTPWLREKEDELEQVFIHDWKELGWGRPQARLSDALAPVATLIEEDSDDLAVKTIVKTARESHPEFPVTHPQHGFMAASLPWVLYRALGASSAVRSVEDVLTRGGECSDLNSLLCALMVARHGEDCLPEEWWEGTLALGLVDHLFEGKSESFDQWIDEEAKWSGEEEEMRRPLREKLKKKGELADQKAKLKKSKPTSVPEMNDEGEEFLAPPPHLWLKPGEEEDPKNRRKIKEARGKRKIDWKEDRRKGQRLHGSED